ncbi:hypothetical protein H2248_010693 [Termitomyces sp. 'cryptogamus']|nr:hypothetical protein H2248_010693 [Termitomyces sp. 'cryptogamus']
MGSLSCCHDPFPETLHIVHQPPEPPKGPPTLRRTSTHAPRLLRLTLMPPQLTPTAPWPTSVPAPQPLTLTLGLPEPREPPPLFPIFATHHQLNTLIPLTYSGVSRQPRGNPRSPMIPSTYQRSMILNHNRHPPPPSSSTKPRRHSRRTPKSSGTFAAMGVLSSRLSSSWAISGVLSILSIALSVSPSLLSLCFDNLVSLLV